MANRKSQEKSSMGKRCELTPSCPSVPAPNHFFDLIKIADLLVSMTKNYYNSTHLSVTIFCEVEEKISGGFSHQNTFLSDCLFEYQKI